MEQQEMSPKELLMEIKKELEVLNHKAGEIEKRLENIEGLIPRKRE